MCTVSWSFVGLSPMNPGLQSLASPCGTFGEHSRKKTVLSTSTSIFPRHYHSVRAPYSSIHSFIHHRRCICLILAVDTSSINIHPCIANGAQHTLRQYEFISYPFHAVCVVVTVDRVGTVVKVLRYKSEGRWFDPRWCH